MFQTGGQTFYDHLSPFIHSIVSSSNFYYGSIWTAMLLTPLKLEVHINSPLATAISPHRLNEHHATRHMLAHQQQRWQNKMYFHKNCAVNQVEYKSDEASQGPSNMGHTLTRFVYIWIYNLTCNQLPFDTCVLASWVGLWMTFFFYSRMSRAPTLPSGSLDNWPPKYLCHFKRVQGPRGF